MVIQNKSFTMIELVMVMVILAVLAVVAVPNMVSITPMRSDMAARKIQSDIRYAQGLAQSLQKRTRVLFDAGADNYSVYVETTPDNWVFAKNPLDKGDYTIQLNSGEFSGIDITTVNFNGAGQPLVFDQWGNPYGGAGAGSALNNPAQVTLTSSSGTTDIFVERGTARVYIQ